MFDKLTALTGLHLGGNSLASLPVGVFDELTALTILLLNANDLASLPAGVFDKLTELTALWLRAIRGRPSRPPRWLCPMTERFWMPGAM